MTFLFFFVLIILSQSLLNAQNILRNENVSLNEKLTLLVRALDNARYEIRVEAQETLTALAEKDLSESQRGELYLYIRRVLLDETLSFEVRYFLHDMMLSKFGEIKDNVRLGVPDVKEFPVSEIKRLFSLLESDSYSQRWGASEKLSWGLRNGKIALDIMYAARQKLLTSNKPETLFWLAPLERDARMTWLNTPDIPENTPDISEQQLKEWVQALSTLKVTLAEKEEAASHKQEEFKPIETIDFSRSEEQKGMPFPITEPSSQYPPFKQDSHVYPNVPAVLAKPGFSPWSNSREMPRSQWMVVRSLEDALACSRYAGKIKNLVETELNRRDLSEVAREELIRLLGLSRPGMVAEFWDNKHHISSQCITLGYAQSVPGGNPSCFSEIKNGKVRCLSGNNLKPGFYNLGEAIPHPSRRDAFFHLISLPTAREQLAYAGISAENEKNRLRQITQRTLMPYLEAKKIFPDKLFSLFPALDDEEFSRIVGCILCEVQDAKCTETASDLTLYEGWETHHERLCIMLCLHGTSSCTDNLLRAIKDNKIAPANIRQTKSDISIPAYIAALILANRVPWEGVDAWLESLKDNTSMLDPKMGALRKKVPSEGHMSRTVNDHFQKSQDAISAQLGATAYGLWMKRHGQVPDANTVKKANYPVILERCGVTPYTR